MTSYSFSKYHRKQPEHTGKGRQDWSHLGKDFWRKHAKTDEVLGLALRGPVIARGGPSKVLGLPPQQDADQREDRSKFLLGI